MDFSDEALMARYAAGDSVALRELFDRYAPVLTRVMARGMATQSETHDLVQKTFLQLHRARRDYRSGSPLRPWLLTIAMNVKRQHLRTLSRRREDALDLDGATDPPVAPHDIERTERRRQVHEALATLPEGQREVITLHWLEELPFPEVAQIVGASLSAVKVRAHRGYERLRRHLAPLDGNPSEDRGILEGES